MRDFKRDLIEIAQHADDPAYSFNFSGKDKIDGVDVSVLEVSSQGATTRFLVNDQDQILRSSFQTSGNQGPIQREVDFSDYRVVEGISIPFKRVTKDNGKVAATSEVKEVKINPMIDPALFKKPTTEES